MQRSQAGDLGVSFFFWVEYSYRVNPLVQAGSCCHQIYSASEYFKTFWTIELANQPVIHYQSEQQGRGVTVVICLSSWGMEKKLKVMAIYLGNMIFELLNLNRPNFLIPNHWDFRFSHSFPIGFPLFFPIFLVFLKNVLRPGWTSRHFSLWQWPSSDEGETPFAGSSSGRQQQKNCHDWVIL